MLKKFWIVTNDGKDTNHAVTEKVKELLEIAGRSCILCEKDAEKNIIRERIPDMIDCAIVIGGDGSLIEVARTLWKRDVPILGINMGTLGYLTEVEVSNLAEDITQMLKGDYLYEERMMLEGWSELPARAGELLRHRMHECCSFDGPSLREKKLYNLLMITRGMTLRGFGKRQNPAGKRRGFEA